MKKSNKKLSKIDAKQKLQNSGAFSHIGRIGGNAIVQKKGKRYMKELGRRGAKARWG